MPYGVFNSLCSQRLAYQRGHSLFILVCRVLQEPLFGE